MCSKSTVNLAMMFSLIHRTNNSGCWKISLVREQQSACGTDDVLGPSRHLWWLNCIILTMVDAVLSDVTEQRWAYCLTKLTHGFLQLLNERILQACPEVKPEAR
jgi:hypothetical protein